MSSSSDRPPDPAHVANPHFLRNRGRPEKRKSESPLAADTMVRTGLIGRDEGQADEQEQDRGDRGGSPTKKVKVRETRRAVPAHFNFLSVSFNFALNRYTWEGLVTQSNGLTEVITLLPSIRIVKFSACK
jgi:hypothetical protein